MHLHMCKLTMSPRCWGFSESDNEGATDSGRSCATANLG
jgi:hypothetical protein